MISKNEEDELFESTVLELQRTIDDFKRICPFCISAQYEWHFMDNFKAYLKELRRCELKTAITISELGIEYANELKKSVNSSEAVVNLLIYPSLINRRTEPYLIENSTRLAIMTKDPDSPDFKSNKKNARLVWYENIQKKKHFLAKRFLQLIHSETQKPEVIPIHWLQGKDSLRLLIDELKSAGLIEGRETEDVIQEHFVVDGQMPTKEPEPIIWKGNKVLLAHLISDLDSIKAIKSDHFWKVTAPHFEWKGKIPKGLRQLATNNPYPNNIELIEKIIKKVKQSH